MKNKPIIATADLIWTEHKAPYSTRFDDIYFMPENGLEETRHVFLNANELDQRWQSLQPTDAFNIFECGFGTGLNFLATAEAWLNGQYASYLNYTAFEGYPLSSVELDKALEAYSSNLSLIETLKSLYISLLDGETVTITENISLRLIICKASELSATKSEDIQYDTVFMDGFSPAKNPDMWSLELCQWLYEHCKPSATLSTFTVAGFVKRNLKQAGFKIAKVPGFSKKREMLTAKK